MSKRSDARAAAARAAHPFPIDLERMFRDYALCLEKAAMIALTQFWNTGGQMDEIDLLICISDGGGAAGVGAVVPPVDLAEYNRQPEPS